MRTSTIERNTLETQITLTLNLDGTGSAAFRLHFYNLYFLVKQILPALVCPSIYVFGHH